MIAHIITRQPLALVFGVALALRLLFVVAFYDEDLSRFDGGDYRLYAIGAEHIVQQRSLDNSLFLVRPPGFPLMIATLGGDDTAVLIANCILGALIAPASVMFARQCGMNGQATAGAIGPTLVGLIVALDPASIVYSAYLGAEPLANLSLILTMIALFASVRSDTMRAALGWAMAAACGLLVSAYVRPASYLLWIVLAIWGLWMFRRRWLALALFAVVSAAGVGAWMAHNGAVFGNVTFSTIGGYNLLYYRAASVYSLGSGTPIDETYVELSRRVEARLGHDTAAVDGGTRHGHYAATAALQAAMQQVALEVFRAHPLVYVTTIPLGLYRTLLSLNFGPGWLQALALVWNGALLLAALAGLWTLWRRRVYPLFWLVALVCGYFIAGTLIVQTSGIDVRARTMLTPLLVVAAVAARRHATAHDMADGGVSVVQ